MSRPVAGFFRHRLHGGAVRGGVHIWNGPPNDPVTGEPLDRSWRWQAEMDGEPIEFDTVWPVCIGDPITEQDYRRYCARTKWAREHAPESAFAERTRPRDLLSTAEPLPF